MRPSQNLPLLPRIYHPCQQCDPPRMYPSLSEYTPIFNNYMQPSKNLPHPPRIYPLLNNYVRPSHNLPLPSRIYPLSIITICDTLGIYPYLRVPEYTPLFSQLYATLPESTPLCLPPSQNISPFLTTICNTPRIYPYIPEYTPPL